MRHDNVSEGNVRITDIDLYLWFGWYQSISYHCGESTVLRRYGGVSLVIDVVYRLTFLSNYGKKKRIIINL